MYVRVSENCNSHCFMCHYAGKSDSYNITFEQYEKLLKHMMKFDYKMIRFTGGEPLLHKNIIDFIKMAKDIGLKTSIITNGYLLPIYVEKLCDVGVDQYIISLDGSTSDIHDDLRQFPGCFDNIIKAINLIKKKGQGIIRINTVVSGRNIHDLCNLYELLVKLGVNQWSVIPIKSKENLWTSDSKKYYFSFRDRVKMAQDIEFLGYSKIFAGTTEEEINSMFCNNLLKKSKKCSVVDNVRFYIPDKDILVPCNCCAHRLKDINFSLDGDMEEVCHKLQLWLKNNTDGCKCEPLNIYLNDYPEVMEKDFLY